MADTLTVSRTEQGRVTVLHLTGILNAQSEAAFTQAAQAAHDSGTHFLLLDLAGLTLIASAGLRAIQNIFKLYTTREEPEQWQAGHPGEVFKSPHLKMAGAGPDVHYVLSLSGFLQHIPIYPDVQAAVDSFGA